MKTETLLFHTEAYRMTLKMNYIIFAVATLSGVAVRTAMLLFTIDSYNGFIKTEYASAAIAICVFLVTAAVVIFLTSFLVRTETEITPTISGIPFTVGAVALAVAAVYETFFSDLVPRQVGLQNTLQYITTIIAAGCLLYIAVCKITGRVFPPYLSIGPIIYWMMRLVTVFTGFSTISTISDTLIETASMCFTLLVLLFYAKIECGQPVKSYRIYYSIALVNGFICALGSIPRIIADIFAVEQAVHLNTIPTFTSLATGTFSVLFAYSLIKQLKK